jgi:hypothetical protein
MSTSPFEIIAGPATIYLAATGTAFPAINATPSASWAQLGKTEGGVTVTYDYSIELLMVDQNSGPQKAIRTEEHLQVAFSLAELTLEQYAKALNNAVVTDTPPGAGTAGHRSFKTRQGFDVALFAMLVRGPSPYMDANLQYEIPVVCQTGAPTISFVRDDKSVLELEWEAIEDRAQATDADRFGTIRAQDAAPI